MPASNLSASSMLASSPSASSAAAPDWVEVCRVDDIPALGARVLERDGGDNIALFRTADGKVFALRDRCPHKGGPLSQGIVAGETVTCPLHSWNLSLDSGQARAPDVGCVATYPVRVENGVVWLSPGLAPAAAHAGPGTDCQHSSSAAVAPMENGLDIRLDNLEGPEVLALLQEHLGSMEHTAPAESRHALDLAGLREPGITFWSVWDGPALAGFGALKHMTESHAEIKSMRTASSHLRRRVASKMLRHLIQEAASRGYSRLSLETGSMEFFEAARNLYASFGFTPCPPFGDYRPDPNSVFMTLDIAGSPGDPFDPKPRRGVT
jgi:putative acetyltransferase